LYRVGLSLRWSVREQYRGVAGSELVLAHLIDVVEKGVGEKLTPMKRGVEERIACKPRPL